MEATNGLKRRVNALEEIAEACRVREEREALRDGIRRSYQDQRLPLTADQLERKVDRAVMLAEAMAPLLASGLTMIEAARHIAQARPLDPDRVVELFTTLRAEREAAR